MSNRDLDYGNSTMLDMEEKLNIAEPKLDGTSFDAISRRDFGMCCGWSRVISDTLGQKEVKQGIGAVLVFVGITLCITGTIFTAVAYGTSSESMVPSFPYAGPILIGVSVCCMIIGYILGHLDGINKICQFFTRRKDYLYEYDGTEHYYMYEEFDDVFSAVCFWAVFKCVMFSNRICPRTRNHSSTEDSKKSGSMTDFLKEDLSDVDLKSNTDKHRSSIVSLSSLLNTKVHPQIVVDNTMPEEGSECKIKSS